MTLKTLGTEIKYARCNGLNTVEVRVEFCKIQRLLPTTVQQSALGYLLPDLLAIFLQSFEN